MNNDLLFKTLSGIAFLSLDFKEYLSEHIICHIFQKGDHMPYRPPVSQTIYFVQYGLVCGVNRTTNVKNTLWIADQASFIVPPLTSSDLFVERIEFLSTTQLIGLESSFLAETFTRFPEAGKLWLGMISRSITESNKRELLLRLPPETRYATLFKQHPQYFISSYNENLASYLNMSLRHFARLKRRFSHSR
ncbi:cyclic nucleotide-binding domain-containing protein [Pedobacter hartonius]|nr:Crp/Fnr family transcriptional regulator [Pedobacter hartonius]